MSALKIIFRLWLCVDIKKMFNKRSQADWNTKLLARSIEKSNSEIIRKSRVSKLAFRGSNDDIYCNRKGNFLSCLDYLSQFDPFIKNHLEKFANCGSTNYLSHKTCDEFINLMAKKLWILYLIAEVKHSKYFAIIVLYNLQLALYKYFHISI
jgi:hypothetical protein